MAKPKNRSVTLYLLVSVFRKLNTRAIAADRSIRSETIQAVRLAMAMSGGLGPYLDDTYMDRRGRDEEASKQAMPLPITEFEWVWRTSMAMQVTMSHILRACVHLYLSEKGSQMVSADDISRRAIKFTNAVAGIESDVIKLRSVMHELLAKSRVRRANGTMAQWPGAIVNLAFTLSMDPWDVVEAMFEQARGAIEKQQRPEGEPVQPAPKPGTLDSGGAAGQPPHEVDPPEDDVDPSMTPPPGWTEDDPRPGEPGSEEWLAAHQPETTEDDHVEI